MVTKKFASKPYAEAIDGLARSRLACRTLRLQAPSAPEKALWTGRNTGHAQPAAQQAIELVVAFLRVVAELRSHTSDPADPQLREEVDVRVERLRQRRELTDRQSRMRLLRDPALAGQ
ncbi:MAG: hypothetical protein H6816_14995 [Phycisphaerales bacterium]|nr:hypothetical protein [Phycisphaerales bacterium]